MLSNLIYFLCIDIKLINDITLSEFLSFLRAFFVSGLERKKEQNRKELDIPYYCSPLKQYIFVRGLCARDSE